ncbi:MAG: GTPase ObgE [Candidatus Omnitrophica bacterium]|nr:GTPase ObgE [Candidatus Omnitrophota bacterium]
MFVDEAKISVKAGRGGDGCSSFERIRGKKYGRPNGGCGGRGGNVVIASDNNKQTLIDFRFNKHFKAKPGGHGGSNNRRGLDGEVCLIRVPPGTLIKDGITGLVLRDLVDVGQKVIIAQGGSGGRGNSPRHDAMRGEPGEERELLLELKIVADVGIVGYPNAGKSTILSKISSARPKIANFPFTTKSPNLGVSRVGDYSFIVADIPGLIEGAHRGRGLGDRFLRHIERTRLLMHIIDVSGLDGRDPCETYAGLNREIELYSSSLLSKPQIVIANKIDIPGSDKAVERLRARVKTRVLEVSALTGKGVKTAMKEVAAALKNLKAT